MVANPFPQETLSMIKKPVYERRVSGLHDPAGGKKCRCVFQRREAEYMQKHGIPASSTRKVLNREYNAIYRVRRHPFRVPSTVFEPLGPHTPSHDNTSSNQRPFNSYASCEAVSLFIPQTIANACKLKFHCTNALQKHMSLPRMKPVNSGPTSPTN